MYELVDMLVILIDSAKSVVSGKRDTGSKRYPFLGSARGAKEAVDLFTQRRIVGLL